MKKIHSFKILLLGLLIILGLTTGKAALAFDDGSEDIFFKDTPIGNEELDKMRGGFITSNGLVIDFAFTANTLVDGQLVNQVALNTADLNSTVGSLRNIVQIGKGNTAFSSTVDTNTLPNVLTVVQNNLDDITLQQLNLLDLSVRNFDSFVNQSVGSEIDFQRSISLAP